MNQLLVIFANIIFLVRGTNDELDRYRGNVVKTVGSAAEEYFHIDENAPHGSCYGVPHETIKKMYPGLFHSTLKHLRTSSNMPDDEDEPITDLDDCCRTAPFFTWNATLLNINGVRRELVSFVDTDGSYIQFFSTGWCESGGACSSCIQKWTLQVLLVVDPEAQYWPPFIFDLFTIPHYCSCSSYW